jgi:membrane protease subunit (stomatin/prohibitin family)
MALISVIKYNGTPDVFAWKYPSEELGTWTQLIVNESQEAVLYKGGKALDLFGSGRHTLSTANIPILNHIINLPFGGRSPFTAEVWYVNKMHSLDIKWGTVTPIQLQDPKYKIFVPVRAFGQFGITVTDSKAFLTKLVGTLPIFSRENITKYFKGVYITKVKDIISKYLILRGIGILEINAYLDELSTFSQKNIMPVFNEYGISLVNFYINDISVPEDDEAVNKLKGALAKKAEMDIVGYSYTQERSFNTLDEAVTNKGSSQSSLMEVGLGAAMGFGLGGGIGAQFGGLAKNINISDTQKCMYCGSEMGASHKFCPSCGKVQTKISGRICQVCGTDNAANIKFCSECGNSLVKTCKKCSAVINGEPKFCPECGEPLLKKCQSCGSAIAGSPKFCPECGNNL